MIKTLTHIIAEIKAGRSISPKQLDHLVRERNRQTHDPQRTVAKKRLMSRYLKERSLNSETWQAWQINEDTHHKVVSTLRAKPRRTASGVATITVLSKPWPCTSDCIYCPNDIRMPKSYMSDEPACQRAERNFFDPYLQVVSRMAVLEDMGHITDKVELIVLGGTWSDYPDEYRIWFTTELFRALNEFEDRDADGSLKRTDSCAAIRDCYESLGYSSDPLVLKARSAEIQERIDSAKLTYNKAIRFLYDDTREEQLFQQRNITSSQGLKKLTDHLIAEQLINETSQHRVVGLVFETRPDKIDENELVFLRTLGATKVQMGIQSLDDSILARNGRHIRCDHIADAFNLLRLFGFKIHIHLMVNLVGANPRNDIEQYQRLVEDERFKPDEVKLYPCALVQSSYLTKLYHDKQWVPYSEDELLDVLTNDVTVTPPYTRISRMIRDISATDILVGNKKTNLRQMVEQKATEAKSSINEMRMREISTSDIDDSELILQVIPYKTISTEEYFIQWITPDNKLAAFLRLSLPDPDAIQNLTQSACISPLTNSAMIREVHVYGRVSKFHESKEGNQHIGLGGSMIDAACTIAAEQGYTDINVISSVGTRQYYRHLGFEDAGLYQRKALNKCI